MKKLMLFVLGLMLSATMWATMNSVASVAAFNAQTSDSVVFTCPLVALIQYNKYLLATDGTDNILIYGSAPDCVNGDTLLNVSGAVVDYNGQHELKNGTYTFTVSGRGEAIQPEEINHVGADNLLTFARLTDVTASVSNKRITFYLADGTTTIAGYNACGITLPNNPSSTLTYTGLVSVNNGTYQFYPMVWEGVDADVTYTKVASIAEFLALADGTNFEFTSPVTVSFVYRIRYNCATFIQDANGDGAQIYDIRHDTNTPYVANYEMRDIIPAGWKGTKIDFNGTKEITPISDFAASTGKGSIRVTERTVATLCEADVNNLVLIKGVSLAESTYVESDKDKEKHRNATDGTTEVFDLYDTFHSNEALTGYVLFPTEDGVYDIVGIAKKYYETYEFSPISFDGKLPGEEESAIHEVGLDKVVKFVENGQLIILHNGVRYNALGARL